MRILLILAFTSFVCLSMAMNDRPLSIEIRKIDFISTYSSRLDCESFENEGGVDTFYIKDKKTIEFVLNQLSQSTEAPTFDAVDTRGKILIKYASGKKDSVCMGYTSIFFYKSKFRRFKSRKLIEMIDSLPMKEQW